MAMRSTRAYVIEEEQDGFVAVDFNIIDADDEWEFINQFDEEEEEDACSFDETADADVVCEKVLMMMGSSPSDTSLDYLAEKIVSHRQFAADVDGDVIKDETDGEIPCEEEDERIILSRSPLAVVYGDVIEDEMDGQDDEEEEGDYDFDDELVPFSVNCKFGKQRMRKLGKRGRPKLLKSKGLTYNTCRRSGFVHGKPGLWIKG